MAIFAEEVQPTLAGDGVIGIEVQANSPDMAAGLHLAKATGVVVADVDPGSPADTAGVQAQDIVTTVDGAPIEIVPMFGLAMSSHAPGDTVTLGPLRGTTVLAVNVPVVDSSNPFTAELVLCPNKFARSSERPQIGGSGPAGRTIPGPPDTALSSLRLC